MKSIMNQMVASMEEMANANIGELPSYKTAMAILNHPKVLFPNRGEVAFAITIEVNENFVNAPEFQSFIDAMVGTLNNIYQQLHKDFGGESMGIFLQIVRKMNIKYTY